MKTSLFLFLLIALSGVSYGQQQKQNIDYQYYRADKNYYAFDLYKDTKDLTDQLMLNFICNTSFKKIDKIIIKTSEKEFKLKFKAREEKVSSDNAEQRYYPIVFNFNALDEINKDCNAEIIFKMDNGVTFSLPFNICAIQEFLSKNKDGLKS